MKNNKPRISQWWQFVVPALFVACLSGCAAIPPVVSQASWALSGVSYVTTNKGPSDHAISYAVEMDCSLFRLLKFQPICKPVSEITNQSILGWIVNKFKKPAVDPVLSSSPRIASTAVQ